MCIYANHDVSFEEEGGRRRVVSCPFFSLVTIPATPIAFQNKHYSEPIERLKNQGCGSPVHEEMRIVTIVEIATHRDTPITFQNKHYSVPIERLKIKGVDLLSTET